MKKIILIILLIIVLLYLTNKHENFALNKCLDKKCIFGDASGNIQYNGKNLAILDLGYDYNIFTSDTSSILEYKRDDGNKKKIINKINEINKNNILDKKILWCIIKYKAGNNIEKGKQYNDKEFKNLLEREMWLLFYIENNKIYLLENSGDAFEFRLDFKNKNTGGKEDRFDRYIEIWNDDKKKTLTIEKYDNNRKIKIRSRNKILNNMNFELKLYQL